MKPGFPRRSRSRWPRIFPEAAPPGEGRASARRAEEQNSRAARERRQGKTLMQQKLEPSGGNQPTLSARIKAHALSLGFDRAAILPISDSLTHPFYRNWLAAGHAGEMGYLHRHAELKQSPGRLAPWARSMVVVALNYHQPAPELPGGSLPRGRVSRYAWGRDYHDVVRDKLKALTGFIESAAGAPVQARSCVDSAPVMEREFAARAGLGWVGKHGVVIDWERGSWLFLAELLLDLVLDYDPPPERRGGLSPAVNRLPPAPKGEAPAENDFFPAPLTHLRESCGSCTACLDACPTGAIVAEKTVDSRKCISYLTIELKGPIPVELREEVGEWVFGCDICQEVCPWNREAPLGAEPEFRATPESAWPSLPALLALDERGFRERFRGTALLRAKRRGLLRNAAIVLANRITGTRTETSPEDRAAALDALKGALADPEPLIRGAAAWALGRIGGAKAREALVRAGATETDETVREEIQRAGGAEK